jgi:hypothetical protein
MFSNMLCYPSLLSDIIGARSRFQISSSRSKPLVSLGGGPVLHVLSEGVGAGVVDNDVEAEEK